MIPDKLFFKDEFVAFLTNSTIEWPRCDSIYELNQNLPRELIDYIQSCIDYSILVEENDCEALQNHIDNVEIKFTHFNESEEWYILDEDGEKHGILSPIFHPENIVVWMTK